MEGRVGGRVVFCQDPGAVVGGEDEDGVDGEKGHVRRHGRDGGVQAHQERIAREVGSAMSWSEVVRQARPDIGVAELS